MAFPPKCRGQSKAGLENGQTAPSAPASRGGYVVGAGAGSSRARFTQVLSVIEAHRQKARKVVLHCPERSWRRRLAVAFPMTTVTPQSKPTDRRNIVAPRTHSRYAQVRSAEASCVGGFRQRRVIMASTDEQAAPRARSTGPSERDCRRFASVGSAWTSTRSSRSLGFSSRARLHF